MSEIKRESIEYDVVIVGAGHNGLIAGTHLAKKGKKQRASTQGAIKQRRDEIDQ